MKKKLSKTEYKRPNLRGAYSKLFYFDRSVFPIFKGELYLTSYNENLVFCCGVGPLGNPVFQFMNGSLYTFVIKKPAGDSDIIRYLEKELKKRLLTKLSIRTP